MKTEQDVLSDRRVDSFEPAEEMNRSCDQPGDGPALDRPAELRQLADAIRADAAEDPLFYLLRSDTGYDGE